MSRSTFCIVLVLSLTLVQCSTSGRSKVRRPSQAANTYCPIGGAEEEAAIRAINLRMLGKSKAKYRTAQDVSSVINDTLIKAMANPDWQCMQIYAAAASAARILNGIMGKAQSLLSQYKKQGLFNSVANIQNKVIDKKFKEARFAALAVSRFTEDFFGRRTREALIHFQNDGSGKEIKTPYRKSGKWKHNGSSYHANFKKRWYKVSDLQWDMKMLWSKWTVESIIFLNRVIRTNPSPDQTLVRVPWNIWKFNGNYTENGDYRENAQVQLAELYAFRARLLSRLAFFWGIQAYHLDDFVWIRRQIMASTDVPATDAVVLKLKKQLRQAGKIYSKLAVSRDQARKIYKGVFFAFVQSVSDRVRFMTLMREECAGRRTGEGDDTSVSSEVVDQMDHMVNCFRFRDNEKPYIAVKNWLNGDLGGVISTTDGSRIDFDRLDSVEAFKALPDRLRFRGDTVKTYRDPFDGSLVQADITSWFRNPPQELLRLQPIAVDTRAMASRWSDSTLSGLFPRVPKSSTVEAGRALKRSWMRFRNSYEGAYFIARLAPLFDGLR